MVNLNAFCPALLGTGGAARASVILVLYRCYTAAKCGILEDKISFCGRDLWTAGGCTKQLKPSRFHLEVVKCASAHDCVLVT